MRASESRWDGARPEGGGSTPPRVDGTTLGDAPAAAAELVPAEGPLSTEEITALWQGLRHGIQKRLRREQFETWFTRAALVHADDARVVVAVHNRFTKDWLDNYYRGVLEIAVGELFDGERELDIVVDPERTYPPPSDAGRGTGQPLDGVAPPARPGPAHAFSPAPGTGNGLLLSSDVVLNPSYRFDSYVVGPCNRFAHAACVGVSEKPGTIYNPMFLHGNVGLGKTHLLQSLCHALLEREPATRILYLSCETFVNHFIAALEGGDLQSFRTKYRNVDVLVVDDIHLLANKERTQEEFFHTFNTLYNAGKQIVLSSDSPPVDIPTLQDRLVSRFKWGLVTEIETPCYETRMAILKRKSRERGRELPEDVASFLAERIESNIRELEGAVTKVLGYASLAHRPVDLALVRECLRELFTVRKGQPSIEDIMGVVTQRFGVKLAELQSRRRTAAIAFPRQVGMFLARRITRMSLEEIGGYFGGRDHSTVLYAVQKIERMYGEDASTNELVSNLLLELRSGQQGA